MSKIRIYSENKIIKGQIILPHKHHIHYLKNVMRKKKDEKIFLFDKNSEWVCKINCKKKFNLLPLKLIRQKNLIPDIWICFGIVKTKNINNLIEKVSEIGVKKIVRMFTEFSMKLNNKIERLRKISIEAVEQSNAITIPEISEIKPLADLLREWDKERLIIFCDEKGGYPILSANKLFKKFKKIAIFIGPVGGWSISDKNIIYEQEIFRVSLGNNILKADTAAIYSLSCLRALME